MNFMAEWLLNLFFLASRCLHIIATALIVGGTLFYELVVPIAIGELKTEVQMVLFARMRWIFRSVVYLSAATLVLTGLVSVYRNWNVMNGDYIRFMVAAAGDQRMYELIRASIFNWPRFWFITHIASGVISLVIAIALVSGGKPPERPLQWMRINLFVLIIAIFLASASRGARQNLFQPLLSDPSGTNARE
jgi:hypothetical protein